MIAYLSSDVSSPEYCFDFRVGIEGEAAAAAARNRTRRDLAALADVLTRMEELDYRVALGLEEDFAFHLQVAKSSHNDYFVSALQSLKLTVADGILLARTTSGLDTSEKMVAINKQHRLIYEAIRAQDAEGARSAMRAHLSRCKKSTSHWHTTEYELVRS